MAWFKVDDGFSTSPKVLSIPRAQRLAAIGLWTIAGTWCAKHLTDGQVPEFMLEEWGADVSHGTALVTARLWAKTSTGYRFHAWNEYQPTRTAVEESRVKERERKEAWRARRQLNTADSPESVPAGVPAGQVRLSGHPDPTRPDPSRPDHVKGGGNAASRGTRIAEPFIVTREMREWASKETPAVDVDRATAKFVDYWRGLSGAKATKKDWLATWRNWMRSDQERAEQRGGKPSKDARALNVVEMGRELAGLEVTKAVGA